MIFKDSSDEIQQKTFSCRVDGSGDYAGNFRLYAERRVQTAARSKSGACKTVWRPALLVYLGSAELYVWSESDEAGRGYS